MAQLISAGLLGYRRNPEGHYEVLLAHPGGPFFARKDVGAWGIPKGLVNAGEELLTAARREFTEELGWAPDEHASFVPLGSVRMKSGKTVHAWCFESGLASVPALPGTSVFTIEWPPKSGRQQAFPEIDRAEFFDRAEAARMMLAAQQPFLTRLWEILSTGEKAGAD